MQIRFLLQWESFKGGRNGGKGEFEWTVSLGFKKKKKKNTLIKDCSAAHEKGSL